VTKRKTRTKAKLPQYVVVKHNPPEWHVRRLFKTDERDEKGRIKYIQVTRRCLPETEERAREISEAIEDEYKSTLAGSEPEKLPTVGEYIERYLAAKKNSVARRTYEHDEDLYRRYVKGTRFSHTSLQDLEPTDVQDLIDELQTGGVSATMTRKLHVFISSAFNQAVKWKRLEANPAAGAIVPKSKRTEKTAMSKTEVARFLQVCQSQPDYLIFEFALKTGMRPQEFIAIPWRNVDLSAGKARVTQAVATGFRGGGFEMKDPKTDAAHRTIAIGEELVERLREHRSHQLQQIEDLKKRAKSTPLLEHMKRKGTNFKKRQLIRKHASEYIQNFAKYDLVFPTAIGGPHSRLNLNRREFKDALAAAKIDPTKYSLQSLRHTNLSMLAEIWPVKRLQKHAGHQRVETTLEYYVHVDEFGAQNGAGDAFDEAAGLKLTSVKGKRAA
jgi:integrase